MDSLAAPRNYAREKDKILVARRANQDSHIPSLDGIRALAALLVFLSHAGLGKLVPGGFGVTVFFFLSGYLITTLLRLEHEKNGKINFKNFYLRRIYRILPPLYIVLIALLSISILQNEKNIDHGALLAQIFHVTNYYIIAFGEQGIVPETAVLWSLAVEEHFYIFFPLIFALLLRTNNRRRAAIVMALMCLGALLWRCLLVFGLDAPSDRVYLGTDTRFDGLLFGCIMGIYLNPHLDEERLVPRSVAGHILIGVAFATILITFLIRNEDFRQTLRYTLQGIALFPLFWAAIRSPESIIFRWLNWAPVRFLGALSYSFYLAHPFFLSLTQETLGKLSGGVAAFLATALFSYFIYRVVELPLARVRRRLH